MKICTEQLKDHRHMGVSPSIKSKPPFLSRRKHKCILQGHFVGCHHTMVLELCAILCVIKHNTQTGPAVCICVSIVTGMVALTLLEGKSLDFMESQKSYYVCDNSWWTNYGSIQQNKQNRKTTGTSFRLSMESNIVARQKSHNTCDCSEQTTMVANIKMIKQKF